MILTAVDAIDPDLMPVVAKFCRETNGMPGLQPGSDAEVTNPLLSLTTMADLPQAAGVYRFYAVAFETTTYEPPFPLGLQSDVASVDVTVRNYVPAIATLSASPDRVRPVPR